jgi:hypothetical protein
VLQSLSICLPLTMTVMLLISGVAKLRHPDDLAGWTEMGVPAPLRRKWLLALHPWGEITLGVLIALLGCWLGVIAGVLAVALMGVYTVLIATVLRRSDDASCACFGERKQITGVTLARNIWLVLLAVGTVCVIGGTPLLGGAAVAAVQGSAWGWLVGLAAAAVTTWLVTRGEPADRSDGERPVPTGVPTADSTDEAGEELDYVRTRTPAIPVTLADGTVKTLRELSTGKPLLLLYVSQTCSVCQAAIDEVGAYRKLLPEVEVRLLLKQSPEDTRLTETAEPQSLHDPKSYVSDSFDGMWGTPAALLFGADGMLAGGPVVGPKDIDVFVKQMRVELDS